MEKAEKLEKFERLAEKRVNNVIKRLRLLGNLANKSNYSYTENHVDQLLRAVKGAVRELEARFRNKGKSEDKGFKFRLRS